jgi:FAD/FMN-containing dehydrogenase
MAIGIEGLQRGFAGEIFRPEDDGYEAARSIWNGECKRRPALIAQCSNSADVAAAIAFGRSEGLELSVRGGGHNFAGHALVQDGLMVNLSEMNQIEVDPAQRRVRCGGGTTWAMLDSATQAHGLAVPGGTISHTGVAGLALGGGFGWLTNKAGLSCDNLLSAEVVTSDGRTITASADEHPDLFWALKGGGGNFGVVTNFEFQLHQVGPLVNAGLFFWDTNQGVEALRVIRETVPKLPRDYGVLFAGLSAPPAPFVPEPYHFKTVFALIVIGFGSAEEHGEAVEPIRQALSPLFELVTPIPYVELQKMLDESAPWGALAYEKALYLDDLSDEVIQVTAEMVPKKASPLSFMPVFPLTGAYADVEDDATAYGGPRSAGIVFNIAAVAPPAEAGLFEVDRAWVRSFWEALRPYASGSGSYVNFIAEEDEDRVRASYGPDKYDRLARIKAEYDPANIFHLNANILPAGT